LHQSHIRAAAYSVFAWPLWRGPGALLHAARACHTLSLSLADCARRAWRGTGARHRHRAFCGTAQLFHRPDLRLPADPCRSACGMSDERPIGVFDSGIGGITVLKALRKALPHEDLVYLGDTARLPYGTKSPETVTAYATQATKHLLGHDVKMVVIACNTASAVALGPLKEALAPIPVIGVIEPGAKAGVKATKTGRIGVIATEATVKGGAYARAIHAAMPEAQVAQAPCGLFVTLAEEGWTKGEVAEAAARRYLAPLFKGRAAPDTLVLGCTHFPVLAGTIRKVVGKQVKLVDS